MIFGLESGDETNGGKKTDAAGVHLVGGTGVLSRGTAGGVRPSTVLRRHDATGRGLNLAVADLSNWGRRAGGCLDCDDC